jgi:serine protease Do
VGVNAAIATESGGFEGIGFTIPSNMAVYVSKALIAHGKVERGWLGVSIRSLTPEMAQSFHMLAPRGALIVDVVKGSPADKAGLRKNDIVVAYGGKEIPDAAMLRNDVAVTPVGQGVKVKVLREGKSEELTIKLESLDKGIEVMAAEVKDRFGLGVRAATAKEAEKYGLNSPQGVVIDYVDPKGPFGEAGFEVDDMILEINRQPILGVEGFVAVMNALKPNQKIAVLALDHRTGNVGTVMVALGAERHFRKARQSFLQNDSQEAASEIRRGAAEIGSEADKATGAGKEILQASIHELEKLADEVRRGTVSSVKKLDEAFDQIQGAMETN